MLNQMSINRLTPITLGVILLVSCSHPADVPIPKNKATPQATAQVALPEDVVPTGQLQDDHISFEFAIYFLPQPKGDPLVELDDLLQKQSQMFKKVDKINRQTADVTVAARIEHDPRHAYAPPIERSLQYYGRGLSRDQAEKLQKTEQALILDFAYPKAHAWDGMRSAVGLMYSLAKAADGVIWDDATREVFSPDKWEEQRIKGWSEGVPEISQHTVIHAYKKDEYVRAITLGMEKFGLPDLVINNFSWSLNRNMGHVVNLLGQALAEGQTLQKPGVFDLDFRAIKNVKVREPQVTNLKEHATGVALLGMKKGVSEDGDPKNRLIEITFERGIGPDIHAQQDQVIGQAFGWEDEIKHVRHDAELEAASQRAREKLPGLRAEFKKGLAPGEFIQVKAPFDRPNGGQEWMWVEVVSWNGDKITGLLKNEPFNIPTLHAGQNVEVSEATVFDYIQRHADGSSDGNETGRLIERRQK